MLSIPFISFQHGFIWLKTFFLDWSLDPSITKCNPLTIIFFFLPLVCIVIFSILRSNGLAYRGFYLSDECDRGMCSEILFLLYRSKFCWLAGWAGNLPPLADCLTQAQASVYFPLTPDSIRVDVLAVFVCVRACVCARLHSPPFARLSTNVLASTCGPFLHRLLKSKPRCNESWNLGFN